MYFSNKNLIRLNRKHFGKRTIFLRSYVVGLLWESQTRQRKKFLNTNKHKKIRKLSINQMLQPLIYWDSELRVAYILGAELEFLFLELYSLN